MLVGQNKSEIEKVAETLCHTSSIYEIDVALNEEVVEVMNRIKDEVGFIDVLVNNAGIGTFDLAENLSEESIHQMIDINLKGTIFCTLAVLKVMKQANKGMIINIISGSGKVAKATESVYSASIFGARGFADALAEELKETDIHIFSAYIGNMKTNLWGSDSEDSELDKYMDPDDVAEIIIDSVKPRKNLMVTDVTILNHR